MIFKKNPTDIRKDKVQINAIRKLMLCDADYVTSEEKPDKCQVSGLCLELVAVSCYYRRADYLGERSCVTTDEKRASVMRPGLASGAG